MNILYVAGFQDSTRTESHVASAFREWGHTVEEHILSGPTLEGLPAYVEQTSPDIVFFTYDSNLINSARRRRGNYAMNVLRSMGVFTAAYHLDRYWDLAREESIQNEPWFKATIVLTADGGNQERFKKAGVNHSWMPPAVHGPDALLHGIPDDRYRCKVAFVGSWQRYHPEWPWRMEMIDALRVRYGDDFRTFPDAISQPIRGQELNNLYASVDVVVGDSIFAGDKRGRLYVSDRPYETLGRKGCLVMPHCDGLEQSFRDGEHLRYFDAGNPISMFSVIDELLSDPAQRDTLRTQGHAEILNNHLYRHRALEMMQRMVEQRPSLVGWTAGVRDGTYDAVAIRETWLDDCYRARGRISPGDTVVDLGANVGAFTIWAALQGANVIAVEPIKENVAQLRKNIATMGVADKVTIIHAAVGEREGNIQMSYFDTDSSQSAFRLDLDNKPMRIGVGVMEIPMRSLVSILPDREVAFLKVDIEGSEIYALDGVDLRCVKRVAVETHNVDPPYTTHEEVKTILERTFSVTEIGGSKEGYVFGRR